MSQLFKFLFALYFLLGIAALFLVMAGVATGAHVGLFFLGLTMTIGIQIVGYSI